MPVITKVIGLAGKLAEAILPIIGAIVGARIDILLAIADAAIQIFDAFQPLIDVIFAGIMDIMPDIVELIGTFADMIKVILPVAINTLMPIITGLVERLVDIATVAVKVGKHITSFAVIIKEALIDKFKQVSKFVGEVVEKLSKFLGISNSASKSSKELSDNNKKLADSTNELSKGAAKYGLSMKDFKEAQEKALKQGISIEEVLRKEAEARAKASERIVTQKSATKALTKEYLEQQDALKRLNALSKSSLGSDKVGGGSSASIRKGDYSMLMPDFKGIREKIELEIELAETQKNIEDFTEALLALDGVDLGGLWEQLNKLDFSKLNADLSKMDTKQLEKMAFIIGSIGAGLGQSLVEIGKNTKDGFKYLAEATLTAIQGLIPVVLLALYTKEILSKGPAGIAIGVGVSALLYALLESAKVGVASMGAEDGGHITAGYNKKAGATDTIPMMLAPNEYVVNAKAVQSGNNLEILEAINSGKDLSTMFVGANGALGDTLNSIKVSTSNIYGTDNKNALRADYGLNRDVLNKLDDINKSIHSQEVSIVDRGRVEIHDNRTIFKKQRCYR